MPSILQIVLFILFLLIIIGFILVFVIKTKQSANISGSGGIPASGVYHHQSNVFGNTLDVNVSVNQVDSMNATFTVQMKQPEILNCDQNTIQLDSKNPNTVNMTLSKCLIDEMNNINLIIKSMNYSSANKSITIIVVWKNVLPLTLTANLT